MYCLDKLQREIAYFFSKDIRELPKVESLLAEAGYTQIRKGDEIIEIDSALGRHSADLGDSTLSQEIKDIIDTSPAKGRDMQIIGEANFTPQVVEYAHKNNKKVAIDKLSQAEAERLGFKHPQDVRVTIDYQAINHTLNRHGADSNLVKESGQKAVDYTDIAKYRSIVKSADESLDSVDNSGNPVLVSYKQVNGHFVVVEQIKKKNNEISFKTMFKENGDYKNSQSYKDTRAKAQTLSIGYEPSANSFAKADEIIPQPSQKSLFDTQAPADTPAQKVDSSVESHTKHQDYNTFNQSLKDAHDFFKANNKDAYNDKLFDDVIKVANALDIRFWYQPNAVYMAGSYTYRLNRIMLQSDNFSKENANTMLHELIHSVTSRAIYAYDNKALREKLSEKQIEAITELKNLYKEVSENNADKVWQKMATFKDELENNKEGKLYGLKNEHEMLAELANPSFREFLKEQNIFSKIIEAMAKIFSYVKDKLTGESIKSTNAQSELETILYKIMDNYTNPHAFTNEMSEHFGSRNFVDTARYKEYIKDHKQKFDKDNYKGKHIFSYFKNSMNFYTKNALSGRNAFIRHFLLNARFNDKDIKLVDEIASKWVRAHTRPENLIDLKTAENAHIFQAAAQAQENNIKDFVKEYYGVSYDEFNNAFNGAMKDKHFYEAKDWKYLGAFKGTIPSKETAFLLALKPYFTSGLYKLLNEADFNVIKDSLYRILQDENLTYRNKPINEWFAKEWVEQDVKALQESFQYKLQQTPQAQKVDSTEPKTKHEQREQTKAILSPLINKPITNQNDGRVAQISRKNIAKMISDKAVAKSVANGFEPAEHFKAVQEVDKLYQKARLKETHKDNKSTNPNVLIHRYNADLDNANALITLKESLSGDNQGNKIYTLELEALELKPSAPEPQGSETMSRNTGYAEPVTPTETLGEIVAQDSNALLESTMKKFNYDERKAKDLLEWHKDSHPLTKDENRLPKVFYHGTKWREIGNKIFEVFDTKYSNQVDKFLQGHYFSSSKKIARTYNANNIYKVFLNAKNPLVIDFKGHTFNDYIDEAINNIPKSVQENIRDFYDSIIFKNIIDDNTQNGKKHPVADTIMVLDSNQIKHIENRGIESEQGHKYFNESSPNIFHSNPHAGAGLLGGSVAGVEQDENGNITFSPEKFALGLLGGAVGSIAISKAKNTLKSTQKAQGQILDLFSIFVENGRIKESALNHYAKKLPKTLNEQEFLAQIPRKDKQGYSTIQTPIGQIQVNLQHAWNHLHKGNTYKKDRSLYSGAFLDTLADPLFVVKQEYTPNPKVSANAREMQNSKLVQTRDVKSIAQDSYVFFKPYKIKDKYTYMVGYALDIQGNIINTTFIPMTSRDFGRIKKMFSSQVLYKNI